MAKPVGHLIFTLHTHLPFVLNHGRWPHGSDWLNEVAVQSYLPLLGMLNRLAADDVAPTVTLNISPILCEQLASPIGIPQSYVQDHRTDLNEQIVDLAGKVQPSQC